MSLPFVSVIIPVYNDAERLAKCLASLERQTYPADRFEIVVIDNASDQPLDPTLAHNGHVILAYEARPGSFVARNAGLAIARGEIIAFTDADCLPEAGWLQAGVEALGAGRAIMGGRIVPFARDPSSPSGVELFEVLFGFRQDLHVRDGFCLTANLFAPRSAFEAAGPFNLALRSNGDYEWCRRASRAGFQIAYAERAVIRHPARSSLAALSGMTARLAGGQFLVHRHEGGPWRARLRALWRARPPLRGILRALRDPQAQGTSRRLTLIGVLLTLRFVFVREWLRLELGGEPRR